MKVPNLKQYVRIRRSKTVSDHTAATNNDGAGYRGISKFLNVPFRPAYDVI